jgi:hypothetical protein
MDANHADSFMRHLIEHAAIVAMLAPFLRDSPESVDFRVSYGQIDPSWFATHLDHDLVVRDEYGKIDGTCAKRYICPHCQTAHYCKLSFAHEGLCR